MDLQFYGANCITVTIQGTRIILDNNLTDMGSKLIAKAGDVMLYTNAHDDKDMDVKLTIDMPGEYEVSDISIYGIPMRAHIDEPKQLSAVSYKILAQDIKLLLLGHIYPDLTDDELENIGTVDVMTVPVGGNGYTIDPVGAVNLIKKIEPKIVIPTYYHDDTLSFPVPAQTLEQALQGLALEVKEQATKFKVKPADFTDTTQLIILEKG